MYALILAHRVALGLLCGPLSVSDPLILSLGYTGFSSSILTVPFARKSIPCLTGETQELTVLQ